MHQRTRLDRFDPKRRGNFGDAAELVVVGTKKTAADDASKKVAIGDGWPSILFQPNGR